MFQVMSRSVPFPLQIWIIFRLVDYFPVSKGITDLSIILTWLIFCEFFGVCLMKSTTRWQVALGSSKEWGAAAHLRWTVVCVPTLSWLCSVTVDELSSISVSVSAVKIDQFKRCSWVHLNALKSCGGLQITGIEDGETILLGHLLIFLFGQSTLAAYFRKPFLRLYCGVELCLIFYRCKLGKASFEIVLADPELVQMRVETWDLVQQVAVRTGGSGTAQKTDWDLLCVSAFSSTPGGATLLFLGKKRLTSISQR